MIGRFGDGTVKIREEPYRAAVRPVARPIAQPSYENPIEMLDRLGIANGELDMFVGYAKKDGFNIDAQVKSFLYAAKERGICVAYSYDPNGHHNTRTALRLLTHGIDWLGQVMAPYFMP